jgi:methionyl-tRNA formyltransferase
LISEPLLSELPMLNVHPSLLPRWRGAAPIERTIMAGDAESGVTIIQLGAGYDSGPMAVQERVALAPREDYGSLSHRLAELGGQLAVRALDLEAAGARRAGRGRGHVCREDRPGGAPPGPGQARRGAGADRPGPEPPPGHLP